MQTISVAGSFEMNKITIGITLLHVYQFVEPILHKIDNISLSKSEHFKILSSAPIVDLELKCNSTHKQSNTNSKSHGVIFNLILENFALVKAS